MQEEIFRSRMLKDYTNESTIEDYVKKIREFVQYLAQNESISDVDQATHKILYNFLMYLNLDRKQRAYYLYPLKKYYMITKNDSMLRSTNVFLDKTTWLDNLSDTLEDHVGEELRNKIMEAGGEIKQTSSSKKKAVWTKCMLDCLEANVDKTTCKKILSNNLHFKPSNTGTIRKLRTKFKKNHDIDEILKIMHLHWLKRMEKSCGRDSKIYEFCEKDPTIEAGVREGNTIFVSKIPYKFKEYMAANTQQEKEFYYCHCGWVRQSILKSEDEKINSTFCNCSGGWHKQPFEAILETPLEFDVVKSVLQGDDRCTFAIHLPDEIINKINDL